MEHRTRTILKTAVHDFIKTGRPVTSHTLFADYDFGIKPAMIRRELHELSTQGFFFQAHPSGGRFPSDEAYEFFVECLLEDANDYENPHVSFVRHMQAYYDEGKIWDFVEDIGAYLEVLSVGYTPHDGRLYAQGLEELLMRFSTSFRDELLQIVHEIELLHDRVPKRWESWEHSEEWPKVFIGENPITKSKHLSVVADYFNADDAHPLLLLMIGPKHMNYQKSLGFLRSFTHTCNT